MKNKREKAFKNYGDFKERRNKLEKRIHEVESQLTQVREDISASVMPVNFIKKTLGLNSSAPVQLGTQALAMRLAGSISNPVARVAVPAVTGLVTRKLTDKQVQLDMIQKLHNAFSWLAQKTKLSADEEAFLLSSEMEIIEVLPGKKTFKAAEVLEAEFREAANKKRQNIEMKIDEADWY
jgi:hypothetical protein